MTPLEHIDFISSAIGHKAYGHCDISLDETHCCHIGYSFHKQQGIFYMHFPTGRTAHTTAFDGPVVDHWLEGKIAQTANAPAMQAQSDDPNLSRRVLYRLSYVPPLVLFSVCFVERVSCTDTIYM